ncbi:hypothetical protein JCM10207_005740 [Rhodosporidiobolus poonsookiae]
MQSANSFRVWLRSVLDRSVPLRPSFDKKLYNAFGRQYMLKYASNPDKAKAYRRKLREESQNKAKEGRNQYDSNSDETINRIKAKMEEWSPEYDRFWSQYNSIGHRTARIYGLDRDAWIRANNLHLRSF